jgi:hypothetical protein
MSTDPPYQSMLQHAGHGAEDVGGVDHRSDGPAHCSLSQQAAPDLPQQATASDASRPMTPAQATL